MAASTAAPGLQPATPVALPTGHRLLHDYDQVTKIMLFFGVSEVNLHIEYNLQAILSNLVYTERKKVEYYFIFIFFLI